MEQNFSKLHSTLKFNLSGNLLVFDFVIQSLDLFVIMDFGDTKRLSVKSNDQKSAAIS